MEVPSLKRCHQLYRRDARIVPDRGSEADQPVAWCGLGDSGWSSRGLVTMRNYCCVTVVVLIGASTYHNSFLSVQRPTIVFKIGQAPQQYRPPPADYDDEGTTTTTAAAAGSSGISNGPVVKKKVYAVDLRGYVKGAPDKHFLFDGLEKSRRLTRTYGPNDPESAWVFLLRQDTPRNGLCKEDQ